MLFQSPRACSTRMTAAETEAKPGRAGNRQVQELELVGRLWPEQEAKSSQMTAGWAPGAAATKARIQAQSGSWKASRNPPLRPPCRQPERCQQRAHQTGPRGFKSLLCRLDDCMTLGSGISLLQFPHLLKITSFMGLRWGLDVRGLKQGLIHDWFLIAYNI